MTDAALETVTRIGSGGPRRLGGVLVRRSNQLFSETTLCRDIPITASRSHADRYRGSSPRTRHRPRIPRGRSAGGVDSARSGQGAQAAPRTPPNARALGPDGALFVLALSQFTLQCGGPRTGDPSRRARGAARSTCALLARLLISSRRRCASSSRSRTLSSIASARRRSEAGACEAARYVVRRISSVAVYGDPDVLIALAPRWASISPPYRGVKWTFGASLHDGDSGSRVWALAAACAVALAAPAAADAIELRSGPLTVRVEAEPFRIDFGGARQPALAQAAGSSWATATRRAGTAAHARATCGSTASAWWASSRPTPATSRSSSPRPGTGVIALRAAPAAAAQAVGIGFEAPPGERFFGFGSRSDAVDHRGRDVENYVEDGPTRESDRNYPRAFVPPWAHGERDDSTYFPVPWLLSSRGYGVLIDRDERSRFRLGTERADAWSLEADAPALALRVFAGPRPPTRCGASRPPPAASPRRRRRGRSARGSRPASRTASSSTRRRRSSPRSATPTCPSRRRRRRCTSCPAAPSATTPSTTPRAPPQFHAAGLAHLVYFNPSLCASYQPVWGDAAAAGAADPRALRAAARLPGVRGRRRARRASRRSRCPSSTSPRPGSRPSTAPCSARPSTAATTAGWRTSARACRRPGWPPTARPARPCTTATRPTTTARCSGSSRRSSRTRCATCARAGPARRAAR